MKPLGQKKSLIISLLLHLCLLISLYSLSELLFTNLQPAIVEIEFYDYSEESEEKSAEIVAEELKNIENKPKITEPKKELNAAKSPINDIETIRASPPLKPEKKEALTVKNDKPEIVVNKTNPQTPQKQKPPAKPKSKPPSLQAKSISQLEESFKNKPSENNNDLNEAKFINLTNSEAKSVNKNLAVYSALKMYQQYLISAVKENWRPVRKVASAENLAVVKTYLQSSGEMLRYELTQKSGDGIFDTQAINAIKLAAPFEKFPDGIPDEKILVVPFYFKNDKLY